MPLRNPPETREKQNGGEVVVCPFCEAGVYEGQEATPYEKAVVHTRDRCLGDQQKVAGEHNTLDKFAGSSP